MTEVQWEILLHARAKIVEALAASDACGQDMLGVYLSSALEELDRTLQRTAEKPVS